MSIVFIYQCAADGCYKKRIKGKVFCKEHEKEISDGKSVSAFYGKTIKKKESCK